MTRSGLLFTVAAALTGAAFSCKDQPANPNLPPKAAFIFNPVSPIFAGQTVVVFNASPSSDPDGSIASYLWDFGDGTPQEDLGASAQHVFVDTPAICTRMTYSVLLTLVDNEGAHGNAAQQVSVIELPDPTSPACKVLPSPSPSPEESPSPEPSPTPSPTPSP